MMTGETYRLTCKDCIHYGLLKMISRGTYSYTEDIPCLRCKRYQENKDEFEPKSLGELQREALK